MERATARHRSDLSIARSGDANRHPGIRIGRAGLRLVLRQLPPAVYFEGGLGFLPAFEARIEPTMHGSGRADTVHGRGPYMGSEMIVAATAIRANDQIYVFQMLAPALPLRGGFPATASGWRGACIFNPWNPPPARGAVEIRCSSVEVPERGRTTAAPGAVCTTCGAELSQTMEVLKSQRLRMMR
jgi:hypothetical protein